MIFVSAIRNKSYSTEKFVRPRRLGSIKKNKPRICSGVTRKGGSRLVDNTIMARHLRSRNKKWFHRKPEARGFHLVEEVKASGHKPRMMYNTVKISYSYQSFAFPIRFYSDAIKAIKALTLYPSLHILDITNNLFHVTRSQSSSERERQMSVNGRGSLLFLFPISPFFHAALPNHTRFEENCI